MALQDRTILFYTANTEEEKFAQKIRDDIKKKAGDIPIISISRKPINFGMNICVGEQPVSYTNEWRQLLIGLKAAKTKFCIATEADCVYPPEYFTFIPPEEEMMYNYNNIYMVWSFKGGYYKKTGYCEGAQMCGREYWIKRLEPLLTEGWEPYSRHTENDLVKRIFSERKEWTGDPVISFKTRRGVSNRTTFINKKVMDLPPYGTINMFKEKFL